MTVFKKIKEILNASEIKYSLKHHEPVYTSEQASRVRGDELKQGAKAIIMNTGKDFVLIVLSAERKINSKKLKKILKSKSLSFAGHDKVKSLGLESGSVPPFGSFFGLKTYVDKSLLKNEDISFNAGSLTDSIKMKLKDYLGIEKPVLADFS